MYTFVLLSEKRSIIVPIVLQPDTADGEEPTESVCRERRRKNKTKLGSLSRSS